MYGAAAIAATLGAKHGYVQSLAICSARLVLAPWSSIPGTFGALLSACTLPQTYSWLIQEGHLMQPTHHGFTKLRCV